MSIAGTKEKHACMQYKHLPGPFETSSKVQIGKIQLVVLICVMSGSLSSY